MKSIRWLSFKSPATLSSVSSKMLSNQYNEEIGRGFLLSSSGKQSISGKYIEKIIQQSVTTDPFGAETESQLTYYYISKFSVNNQSCLLELDSPPRSVKRFASELHRLVGLGLELSDISVDPLTWLENIEKTIAPVTVKHISASGIAVPKSGLAKISVSGKSDIRKEFKTMVGDRNRNIESVKFWGSFDGREISAELLKSGAIRFSGHEYDSFTSEIKSSLEQAFSVR